MSPAPTGGAGGAGGPRRAVEAARLRAHVEALEGERHPGRSPEALEEALRYCEEVFEDLGLGHGRHAFELGGRTHENVVATLEGTDPGAPRVLVGAHVDTVPGTPGADDNASGVAGVLEVARVLAGGRGRGGGSGGGGGGGGGGEGGRLRATVELAIFNLEERQGLTYRVGSRRWAADAKARGAGYAGALIFEMIGYRTSEPVTQRVPAPIRWMDIPRTGDFLACIGDRDSRALVGTFVEAAGAAAPDLEVVTLNVPFRGWCVPATRRSDNASFWSEGWPALMLTDTADLRNPHYHRRSDRVGTLDFGFMTDVVEATVETVRRLAG